MEHSYFGEWVNNIPELNKKFINNDPFPHLIIENFLNAEFMEKISTEFPNNYDSWHKYNNPLEVKYAYDIVSNFPENIKVLFDVFKSEKMIELISQISSIPSLEADPKLHGCGLHAHPKNGRLFVHLDYEKHPILQNKERRINIILYVSKNWKPEWNGATELWNNKLVKKSEVIFNNALIFQTNDISWHGIPEKINCPENEFRKTIAYYYLSPIVSETKTDKIGNDGSGYRSKATYINVGEPDSRIDEFIKIRPHRRIEKEDIDKIWPTWNSEI